MQNSCLNNGGWTVTRRVQAKLDTKTFSSSSSSSNLVTKCSSFPQALPITTPLFLSTSLIKRIATIPIATTRNPNPLSSIVSPQSSNSAITATSDDGENHSGNFRRWIELVGEVLSTAFPIWVALACILGLVKPNSFNWVQPKLTLVGITVIMLGMGMTLTIGDLRGALAMPKELLCGFFLQYSVMPLSGFFVSKLLGLPSYYAAGLILVACCPGGTASNIVTYIARGNVALSVLMTALSTVSAVVMTPLLTAKLAGQYVAVDAAGLLISTLQVVLLPVLVGALLNQFCRSFVEMVSPLMPPVAVLTVAALCGSAIAQNASAILTSGRQLVLASCLLHGLGYTLGYLLSRMLKLDESSSRTISIEVGMQNSALGLVLAGQHFGNPLTAVPCAVSSVFQSLFGSLLAGIWRYSSSTTTPTTNDRNSDNDNSIPGIIS
ncbi:hypothetical protein MKX03_002889 [Papaver bracteatum]|nr:hypothetical protein MKX03_002889 [Papaver bracteatum]